MLKQKKSLAIVSSFDDFCGNASYTRALANGLSEHFEVTVISLNVDLLRKGKQKLAKAHIEKICEQLKQFDYANIQFEAGLFGSDIRSIKKRVLAIIKACKNMVLTMHRYHSAEKYPNFLSLGKAFLNFGKKGKLKAIAGELKHVYTVNRHLPLYNDIIKFCKKNNFPIIVHTKKSKELIGRKSNYDRVFDHPLCFYSQDHINTIRRTYTRTEFCKDLSLDQNKTYIGIFGFISKYKGYETVIKALNCLPNEFELLIFGAQHPHTFKLDESINPYIDTLINLIKKLKLENRVKFHRALNDDEFLKFMIGCDINVLAYLEVNQGGSAIAALSLETNSNTIFSQNNAFFELEKYAINSFKMFTMGNYLELASAIASYRKESYASNLQEYHKNYNIQTSSELYKKLLEQSSTLPQP